MSEDIEKTTAEICQLCGREYLIVYRLPDDIWERITGKKNGGLLCPICADVLAREAGISLYWETTTNAFPTEKESEQTDMDKKIAEWWNIIENGDPDDSDGLRETARQAICQLEACRTEKQAVLLQAQTAIGLMKVELPNRFKEIEQRTKDAVWEKLKPELEKIAGAKHMVLLQQAIYSAEVTS